MIVSRLPCLAVRVARRHPIVAASSAAALVFAVDAVLDRTALPLPLNALLDESAHLATALLLLGALFSRPAPAFLAGVALGSVAIDVDHIPLLIAHHGDQFGVPRPNSHSLLTVLLIAAASRLLPARYRLAALGVACGIAAHFMRDMATGGVPLLWPLTPAFFSLPYTAYVAILLAAVALVVWRARLTLAAAQP